MHHLRHNVYNMIQLSAYHASYTGCPKIDFFKENIENVKKILEEDFPKAPDDPTISTCRKNRSGLSKSSFNRIAKNCLKFHPYKMEKKHEMKEKDFADRLEFAQWYCSLSLEEKENFGFSDEASFCLN